MPRLRKLTNAEIATLAPTDPDARAQLAAHDDAFLSALHPGT